jgi:ankyrin repeat protein
MATWEQYQSTMKAPPGLCEAARANDLASIERMLGEGQDIEATDARGYSPLMLAVYSGNEEAARLLLDRGADPNGRDRSGSTPLMGAAFKGHLRLVDLLLRSGADREARNEAGAGALHFANLFGRDDVAALLQGANR